MLSHAQLRICLLIPLALGLLCAGCDDAKKSLQNIAESTLKKAAEETLDKVLDGKPSTTEEPADSRRVATSVPASIPATSARPTDSLIRIASFNIQVFGTAKLQNADVMRILARVIQYFDVVAIQEIRSTDSTVMDQFVSLINSSLGLNRGMTPRASNVAATGVMRERVSGERPTSCAD